MGWNGSAITEIENRVLTAVGEHPFWRAYLKTQISRNWAGARLHVAVFVEPFLSDVLQGRKTIESRFSSRRTPPFSSVSAGDVILLKASGGPIVGICRADAVWFYRTSAKSWGEIRDRFAQAMCAEDPAFWDARRNRSFATLIRLSDVLALSPLQYQKQDRRGWLIEQPKSDQLEL